MLKVLSVWMCNELHSYLFSLLASYRGMGSMSLPFTS